MKTKQPLLDQRQEGLTTFPLLEWVTAFVLALVLAALAWMAVADLLPVSWRLLSLEAEILGALGLLTAALLLVSVLALLHTRDRPAHC
jgi:CHASE2 domain-containing sensor protein